MEPLIWNKPPIWNTYAADRVVFRIGGFTVFEKLKNLSPLTTYTKFCQNRKNGFDQFNSQNLFIKKRILE